MSDLLRRIDAHLNQCHRHDESERLLAEAKAEIARLNHEMEATKEAARAREAMLVEALQEIIPMTDEAVKVPAAAERWLDRIEECARAALNGEANQ